MGDNVKYMYGVNNTAKANTMTAIQFTHDNITVKSDRNNTRKVMVIVTDSNSVDSVKSVSDKMRKANIEMFAVGYNKAVLDELNEIADDEDHVFKAENAVDLLTLKSDLVEKICNQDKKVPDVNVKVETEVSQEETTKKSSTPETTTKHSVDQKQDTTSKKSEPTEITTKQQVTETSNN